MTKPTPQLLAAYLHLDSTEGWAVADLNSCEEVVARAMIATGVCERDGYLPDVAHLRHYSGVSDFLIDAPEEDKAAIQSWATANGECA